MSASLNDGLDLIRTDVQLLLRRYKRRVQAAGESNYKSQVGELERTNALLPAEEQVPIDHLEIAREALHQACSDWLGLEGPQKAIEA